jgi:hypothetical protein
MVKWRIREGYSPLHGRECFWLDVRREYAPGWMPPSLARWYMRWRPKDWHLSLELLKRGEAFRSVTGAQLQVIEEG